MPRRVSAHHRNNRLKHDDKTMIIDGSYIKATGMVLFFRPYRWKSETERDEKCFTLRFGSRDFRIKSEHKLFCILWTVAEVTDRDLPILNICLIDGIYWASNEAVKTSKNLRLLNFYVVNFMTFSESIVQKLKLLKYF